jgi:phosphatidylserine/phosphatidylglycerophosphate/cardiolipin synthase-like enzyme
MLLDIGEAKGTEEKTVESFLINFRARHWPSGQPLPEIWYDPKAILTDAKERGVAHAKCVVADNRWLFVSSANFTEAALTRNLEAGLLVESPQLARQMVPFLERLIDEGRIRLAVGSGLAKAR